MGLYSLPTHPALLIQQVQNPQPGLDQINAGLVVVEVDHLPLDPFLQHKTKPFKYAVLPFAKLTVLQTSFSIFLFIHFLYLDLP